MAEKPLEMTTGTSGTRTWILLLSADREPHPWLQGDITEARATALTALLLAGTSHRVFSELCITAPTPERKPPTP